MLIKLENTTKNLYTKLKNLSTTDKILLSIFIIVIATCIMKFKINGGSMDFYWMINLGDYIVNNKSLPETNIWVIHDNFKIICQSWLSSLGVYAWFKMFNENINNLQYLGYIYIIIHTIAAYKYCKLFTENKILALASSSFCTLAIGELLKSRPLIISSAIFYIELALLVKFYVQKTNTDFKKLVISLAIISTFISNWQSASWLFIIILELPFIAQTLIYLLGIIKTNVDKKLYKLQLKQQLISIPIIILAGLINPYGYKAELYLLYIREENQLCFEFPSYIGEQARVELFSFTWYVMIALIITLIIGLKLHKVQPYEVFLTLGTLLVAAIQIRQSCMITYGSMPILIKLVSTKVDKLEKFKIKSNLIKYILIFLIAFYVSSVLIIIQYTTYADRAFKQIVEALDNDVQSNNLDKSELKIMSEHWPSAYFQYNGYKTYGDTRLETNSTYISGQAPRMNNDLELDILKEFIYLGYSQLDIRYYDNFFDYYDFDYVVTNLDNFTTYLTSNEDNWQEIVIEDSKTTYRLFKRIRN